MALTKSQKTDVIAELKNIVDGDVSSGVFVTFNGLTVADVNLLRTNLRAAGVGYKVAKKTLLRRVLESKNYKGTMPELNGEIGFAYSSDLLAPARTVFEFQKTHKDKVTFSGGIFDGEFKDAAGMMTLATIPPKETLYAQFAFLLKAPIQSLAIGLQAVADAKA